MHCETFQFTVTDGSLPKCMLSCFTAGTESLVSSNNKSQNVCTEKKSRKTMRLQRLINVVYEGSANLRHGCYAGGMRRGIIWHCDQSYRLTIQCGKLFYSKSLLNNCGFFFRLTRILKFLLAKLLIIIIIDMVTLLTNYRPNGMIFMTVCVTHDSPL
jgi:hypothetical protein